MTKFPNILLTILGSVVLYILTIFPRGGYFSFLGISGFPLSILIGVIVYYTVMALVIRRFMSNKKKVIILVIAIAPFILEFIFRIFCFEESLISLPDSIFKTVAIILSWMVFGYWKNIPLRVVASVMILFATVWFSFSGFDYWKNYLHIGSFDGKKYQHVNSEIIVQDANGEYENLESLYKHYILLDFWSRRCGVCYEMMPEVERLYDKYKDSEDVKVYSVFCRYEGDKCNAGDSIVRSRGYSFPVVSIDYEENSALMKEIGVERYPQIMILDSDNNIVYHGELSLAEKFLDNEGI